jgi:hypothetical protein
MFKSGQAFTAFEDDAWIDFFTKFDYKPLSAKKLSTTLLNEAYTQRPFEIGVIDNRYLCNNASIIREDREDTINSARLYSSLQLASNLLTTAKTHSIATYTKMISNLALVIRF